MSNIDPIRVDVELTGADEAADALDDVATAAKEVEDLNPDVTVDTSAVAGAVGDLDRLKTAANDADSALSDVGGDTAAGDRLRTVGDDSERVADGMGRARDNLANFAGNAITEIPGVSSAFGPLTQGVSEMAEGLAAGELNLKGLLTAGVGMGAVSVIMSQIADDARKAAEAKAFSEQEVKDYTKALQEAQGVLDVLAEKLNETGKIEITSGIELFDKMSKIDIAPTLEAAGQSLADFSAAVEGGQTHIDAWGQAMKDAGIDVEDANLLVTAATQQADQLSTAHERSERVAKLMGDGYETAAQKAKRLADEQANAETKAKDLDAAWSKLLGTLSDDEALLNLKDDFDAAQKAAEDAFAASSAGAEDTEAKTRDADQALIDLKQSVADYAREVLELPPDQTSKIIADMDWASLAATEAELERMARDREVEVTVRPGRGWGDWGNVGWATGAGRATSFDAPPIINVTQHLPAGYGSANAAIREAHSAARRSGGLYSRVGHR